MIKKKEKIIVAMSGGVDSSVVAALLVKQGYDVTGAFMVNYQASLSELGSTSSSEMLAERSAEESCWHGDYQDAMRVAAKLNIPLLRLDFIREYKEKVLDYMYSEYEKGRTPNPDVLCNKFVKFGVWLDKIKELGFDKIATGHYAQIRNKKKGIRKNKFLTRYSLLIPKDENKDQTYFLNQLNQEQLSQTLFPLGRYTKPQVRRLAKKFALPTSDKEESMGICFVGEVPMKEFLGTRITQKKGEITLSDGTILGEHDGLAFYTIGQRHGFQQSGGTKPLFVVGKDLENNRLIVGYEDDPKLWTKEIEVENIHWIANIVPKFPLRAKVRLRHRQKLQSCIIENNKIIFKKSQRAATPGQFAVIYKGRVCLGGGVIK